MQAVFYISALAGAVFLTSSPVEAATIEVVIEKLAFQPVTINAAVGDTIKWVNKDVMQHTATVEGGFDIVIAPHQSASTVIATAGTADYYCRFHPNMRGRIVTGTK